MQNNIQRHLTLIYGMNSDGMKSCSKSYEKLKINLKRYKTDEGVVRNFNTALKSKLFLSKLQKKFFKKYRKPIFSKIENNGKKIIYKVGGNIWTN